MLLNSVVFYLLNNFTTIYIKILNLLSLIGYYFKIIYAVLDLDANEILCVNDYKEK